MSGRERILAIGVLVAIVLAGGGFLFLTLFWNPMNKLKGDIASKRVEIASKRKRVGDVQAEKAKLDHWRQVSVPANPKDPTLGLREYEQYVGDLMVASKFAAGSYTVTARPLDTKSAPTLPSRRELGKKEPIYTVLSFQVLARGDLYSLVDFLERFYKTALLHQIKYLSIQRPLTAVTTQQQQQQRQRERDLDINMTIEALMLDRAENRPALVPNDNTVDRRVLAETTREYASIGAKDLFFGAPPRQIQEKPEQKPKGDGVKVSQFVYLTDITKSDIRREAFLYDRYNNIRKRLRAWPEDPKRIELGHNSFQITDNIGQVQVKAIVVLIDERDVVFHVDDKYYLLHVGISVDEAMKRPMTPEQLKALGLEKVVAAAKDAQDD